MGMSTSVIGFISSDNDTYQKHARVLMACMDAGISELPKETADYFGSKWPEKYLLEDKLTIELKTHVYADCCSQGFEVIVSEIPEGVHKIRFINSY